MAGHHAYTRHEPAGVVAVVSPWNMPLTLAVHRVAPALAWGNAVVLKPAEQSPAFGGAARAARHPRRVCPPACSTWCRASAPGRPASCWSPRPGWTGWRSPASRPPAPRVAAAAAANLVPVSAECGGKGAALVFADATLDEAVRDCAGGVFANSGQVCHSTGRIYVQRPVYDEFLAGLVAQAEKLSLGDPMDPSVDLGPLAGAEHFRKVCGYLDSIPADGGTVLTGGPLRRGRLVRGADRRGRSAAGRPGLPRGGLRPGRGRHAVRHRRRGGGAGQRHAVRPVRAAVHRQPAPRAPAWRTGCGPASSGWTPRAAATRARRSAGTACPAWAERAATGAATSTPRPRPS